MPRVRTLQRSFTGGVIAPSLWGHVEDAKFLTGAAVMENMIPWPQGKMVMRPGTAYVNEVSDSTKTSVLRAFGAGASQGYTVGIEEGKFRFYIDGATLLWATARQVASVDDTANTITFTEPHGFTADQLVRIVVPSGSTIPTGLTSTADLYVIVTNTTTIQLASTSLGAAINITSTGALPLWVYAASEMPDDYISSKNASGVTAGALDVTSHGLSHGNPIELTVSFTFTINASTEVCTAPANVVLNYAPVTVSSSGTLPTGLSADTVYYAGSASPATLFYLYDAPSGNIVGVTDTGSGTHTVHLATGAVVLASTPALYVGTTYYARVTNANRITIHPTAADAIAGTNAVTLSGAGNGTTRVHYAYTKGDLVNYPNAGIYYCEIDNPQDSAPGGADWYLLPFTGEYQIPNPYVESNLLYLDRDQIGDTLTLAHPDHGLYDLVREDDLRWTFTAVSLEPEIDAPQGVAGTATLGENLECTFSNASSALFTTGSAHLFGANTTTVYLTVLTGTVGDGSGLYVVKDVNSVPGNNFTLKYVDGGEDVGSSSTGTALVQQSSLAAEIENHYFVTAVRADGVESDVSTKVTVTNNLFVSGAYNTITWLSVTGAERYRVYKSKHGLAGIIGETYETNFRDDNIAPDMSYTPPRIDTTIGRPGVVASFEQRRVLSGDESDNQNIWFTDLGTTNSLTFHIPILDTDRISFEVQSPLQAAIRFVAPSANLVVFTESTEFVMTTVDSEALTPTSFRARPVSYTGCTIVKPLLVDDKIFFCARGGHVYEFSLRAAFEGYKPKDASIRAPQLFDGYSIVDSAYQKSPIPVMWFVRSDGALLGFTYASDEDVGGWHIHTTDGYFERVCVAAEGTEDRVYVIVRRTINGNTVRYVERFAPFAEVTNIASAFHVDCGIAYSGASASTVSGYDHLEGETVVANVAGTVVTDLTVSSGDVATGVASTTKVIGLPYTGTFQSLPVAVNVDGASAQGRVKGANRAYARVVNSGEFLMGVTDEEDEMVPCGEEGALTSDEARIALPGAWSEGGQIYIKQPNPLPLQVVSLTIDVELGGG